MGYFKVIVALLTISLIQGFASAKVLKELQSDVEETQALTLQEINKLDSAARSVTDCLNDVQDLVQQITKLSGVCQQSITFFGQLATQIGTCVQGGATGAATCLTSIISQINTFVASIQSEVTAASAAIGADIQSLGSCMTATPPAATITN